MLHHLPWQWRGELLYSPYYTLVGARALLLFRRPETWDYERRHTQYSADYALCRLLAPLSAGALKA